MKLKSITLQNFRGIEKLTIVLDEKTTVFFGINGVGKSTILRAVDLIYANIIANFLGLGWAATPAGLKAMEELGKLNHGSTSASNAMCNFLILNISSLQLIPVNVIAFRSQYGSVEPTAIVGAGIVATTISTAAGIVFCKVMDRKKTRRA